MTVLDAMPRSEFAALWARAASPVVTRDLERLPDEVRARCYAGAAWYAEHRNGPKQVPFRPWTSRAIRGARDRARFMTTVLTTYQLAVRDVDWLARELDEVREELSKTRMRAELGSQLAQAWHRANEITDMLAVDTAPIPKQRGLEPVGEAS